MNEILGKRILILLDKERMTQRKLADTVGVTEVSMCRYIKGDRTPKPSILVNIAAALHTTLEYLLGAEENADSELEYYKTLRSIARNAEKWTSKQKAALVIALFGAK